MQTSPKKQTINTHLEWDFHGTVPWPQEADKQTLSSSIPSCHTLPALCQVFIPQDKPEGQAARDELQSAALSSMAFDNAKQLGANKVTTSAKQMNQLLHVQSPALTKRGEAAQEGEWAMKLLGEAIFLSLLCLWSPPSLSDG